MHMETLTPKHEAFRLFPVSSASESTYRWASRPAAAPTSWLQEPQLVPIP